MSMTVEDRLARLAGELLATSDPITFDEIRDGCGPAITAFDERDVEHAHRDSRRRRILVAAAAAVLVLLAVASVAAITRSRPTRTNRPVEPTPTWTDGRFTIPSPPEGWALVGLDDRLMESAEQDRESRIYAVDPLRPETAPAIEVSTFAVATGSPAVPSGALSVDIDSATGRLYDELGRRVLAVERDGFWFQLWGNRVTDDELVAAARVAHRSGTGSVTIDPAGLPAGMRELAVGFRSSWFFNPAASTAMVPVESWISGDRTVYPWTAVQLTSADDPDLVAAQRLWSSDVVELEVRGHPGVLIVDGENEGYLRLVWTEYGRTQLVSSSGISRKDLLAFVELLEPATASEWTAMQASVAPPIAVADPATGVPPPGSRIPTGVTQFPALDDAAVPDAGRGPTYAYYAYSGVGVNVPGSSWLGAVASVTAPGDIYLIAVSTPEAAEIYKGSRSVTLVGPRATITINGADADTANELLDVVEPTIAGDELTGYRFNGPLPTGYDEVAAPFGQSLSTGAWPVLQVLNGTVAVSVEPTPIGYERVTYAVQMTPVVTKFGTGYISVEPVTRLVVELDDGTTLVATGNELSRAELLAAIDAVELVTEDEWNVRYHPSPPTVPYVIDAADDATAGTTPAEGTLPADADEIAPPPTEP